MPNQLSFSATANFDPITGSQPVGLQPMVRLFRKCEVQLTSAKLFVAVHQGAPRV